MDAAGDARVTTAPVAAERLKLGCEGAGLELQVRLECGAPSQLQRFVRRLRYAPRGKTGPFFGGPQDISPQMSR
jgi:hypothetical protein